MKLLSIRLHPFGAAVDRTCTLDQGLNVLEGPNEFGKSTMSHALLHALFTPTNLPPAKLRVTMGRWYPLPAGDHVQVTLCFDADGTTWTLVKTWGAAAASRLEAKEAASMADPIKVQGKLLALLRLNEATWRQVLFTGQAELSQTIAQLKTKGGALDDVHALLKGTAAIAGDIAPEKLHKGLQERIDEHFKRWDISTKGPEDGRGLDKPWALGKDNENYPVLRAWYGKETLKRELDKVLTFKRQIDEVNSRIRTSNDQLKLDEAFVEEGRKLQPGLIRRDTLVEKITRLTGVEKALMKIVNEWPGANTAMKDKDAELERLDKRIESLQLEMANARKSANAQALIQGHKRFTAARADMEEAKQKLAKASPVNDQVLTELNELEKQIEKHRFQIEAQKLTATIESSGERSITIQRGGDEAETVELVPAHSWKGEADGRISFEYEGVRIGVSSGKEDVDALFTKQDSDKRRRAELLKEIGHESLLKVVAAAKEYADLANEVKTKAGLYTAALQERSLEQWEADMADIAKLPATRAINELELELGTCQQQKAELAESIRTYRKNVEQWVGEHTDVDTLLLKVIEAKTELKGSQEDIDRLPKLPEGYATAEAYTNTFREKEQAQDSLKEILATAKEDKARLEGATPEYTVEEIQSELDVKARDFDRQMAEGDALIRIRQKLETIITERGDNDPMQGLTEAISNHLNTLTEGCYQGVELDGTAPVNVNNGKVDLASERLSQGTLGSLALATRLALAELYLKDDNGFIVMDDPFTDMDPGRRKAAARALSSFAKQRQVLLFTCHPLHAEELLKEDGAKLAEVVG